MPERLPGYGRTRYEVRRWFTGSEKPGRDHVLDTAVEKLTDRTKGVPKNQLMMKMRVNQAYQK